MYVGDASYEYRTGSAAINRSNSLNLEPERANNTQQPTKTFTIVGTTELIRTCTEIQGDTSFGMFGPAVFESSVNKY